MLDENAQTREEEFKEKQEEAVFEKDPPQKKNDSNSGHKVPCVKIWSNKTNNLKLLDEEETRNTIYVANVSEPHKSVLSEQGATEPIITRFWWSKA